MRGDLDLDGDVDATDRTIAVGTFQGVTLGRGALSDIGNRKGYAGYERDANFSMKWHVRHRVLDSGLGRWLQRDPMGYVDGVSLFEYARSMPAMQLDPLGLFLPYLSVETVVAGVQKISKLGG